MMCVGLEPSCELLLPSVAGTPASAKPSPAVPISTVLLASLSRIALARLKTQSYKSCKSMHTRLQKKEEPSKLKNGQKTMTLLAD